MSLAWKSQTFLCFTQRQQMGGLKTQGRARNPSPKIALDTPPMICFPRGNGHRPDQSHFLSPPSTFCSPKIAQYVLPPPPPICRFPTVHPTPFQIIFFPLFLGPQNYKARLGFGQGIGRSRPTGPKGIPFKIGERRKVRPSVCGIQQPSLSRKHPSRRAILLWPRNAQKNARCRSIQKDSYSNIVFFFKLQSVQTKLPTDFLFLVVN